MSANDLISIFVVGAGGAGFIALISANRILTEAKELNEDTTRKVIAIRLLVMDRHQSKTDDASAA